MRSCRLFMSIVHAGLACAGRDSRSSNWHRIVFQLCSNVLVDARTEWASDVDSQLASPRNECLLWRSSFECISLPVELAFYEIVADKTSCLCFYDILYYANGNIQNISHENIEDKNHRQHGIISQWRRKYVLVFIWRIQLPGNDLQVKWKS